MRINIGETHATVQSGGSTAAARIIECKVDERGAVVQVLLDRVIHHSYWHEVDWEADGAFATVLTRKEGADPYFRPGERRLTELDAEVSAGALALGEYLEDEALGLEVAASVRAVAQDEWRTHLMRRRVVQGAIAEALGSDESRVAGCLEIIERHEEF